MQICTQRNRLSEKYRYVCLLVLAILILQPLAMTTHSVSAAQATPTAMCVIEATPTSLPIATPRVEDTSDLGPSPSPIFGEFDQIYFDLLITQQQTLLDLARLGAVRANSPELQQLSERTITKSESLLDFIQQAQVGVGSAGLNGRELMARLDEVSRLHPASGGIPGAMEIISGESAVAQLCTINVNFDRYYLDALIEQIDAGIVLSQATIEYADLGITRVTAQFVVLADRPIEDGAIAIRDGILGATPVASPASGGL
jgi:uncharacterized protein (DUF305 family)